MRVPPARPKRHRASSGQQTLGNWEPSAALCNTDFLDKAGQLLTVLSFCIFLLYIKYTRRGLKLYITSCSDLKFELIVTLSASKFSPATLRELETNEI